MSTRLRFTGGHIYPTEEWLTIGAEINPPGAKSLRLFVLSLTTHLKHSGAEVRQRALFVGGVTAGEDDGEESAVGGDDASRPREHHEPKVLGP